MESKKGFFPWLIGFSVHDFIGELGHTEPIREVFKITLVGVFCGMKPSSRIGV